MFWSSFAPDKYRSNLRMASELLKGASNKLNNEIGSERRIVATQIRDKKFDLVSFKVETVISKEKERAALERLQVLAEMCIARINLVCSTKTCPEDMIETLSTLIWASRRLNFESLNTVVEQLGLKYGRPFVENAMRGKDVSKEIQDYLLVTPPEGSEKVKILKEIATQNHLEYDPARDTPRLTVSTVKEVPGPIPAAIDVIPAAGKVEAPVATVVPTGAVFVDPLTGVPITSPFGFPPSGGMPMPGMPMPYSGAGAPLTPFLPSYHFPGSDDRSGGGMPPPYMPIVPTPPVVASNGYSYGPARIDPAKLDMPPSSGSCGTSPATSSSPAALTQENARKFAEDAMASIGRTIPAGSTVTVILPDVPVSSNPTGSMPPRACPDLVTKEASGGSCPSNEPSPLTPPIDNGGSVLASLEARFAHLKALPVPDVKR